MFAFIKNFLEKLAKQNEKTYGSETPDCCTINKPQEHFHPNHKPEQK